MTDQTQLEAKARPSRGLSLAALLVGILIGGGAMAMFGPTRQLPAAPVPATAPQATIPSETSQAIADLRTGQEKAADQLQAIQKTLASDEANAKQLSSQVGSVNDKMEALRQSFASQQAASPTAPAPAPVNRRSRVRQQP